MNLYYYEHCPFCMRVLVTVGLLNIELDKKILLNDDEETPISMVGKKMVPILEKEPGVFMGESLDIVDYLNNQAGNKLEKNADDIAKVETFLADIRIPSYSLTMPRVISIGLKEFETQSAIDYYVKKKSEHFGESFETMLENTDLHIKNLEQALAQYQSLFNELKNKPYSVASIMLFSGLFVAYSLNIANFTLAQEFMNVMQEKSNIAYLSTEK